MATVERQVRFWQVTDPGGNPLAGTFPAREVLKKIDALGVQGSLHKFGDGWRLMAQTLRTNAPQHLALYRVRRENLPTVEESGTFKDLELADNQNLAEATHFRFFPRNVVGLLFNHDGPQISRLEHYLSVKAGVRVSFAPVLRGHPEDTLDRLRDVSAVEFKIPVNSAHLLTSNDNAIKALREMAEKSLSKTLYVKMTLWGSTSPHAATKWRKTIGKIIGSSMFSAFSGVKVRGWDVGAGRRETIDLVAEHLTMKRSVELTSEEARTIRNASAAKAIEDAYSALESAINGSVPPLETPKTPLRAKDLRKP